MTATFELANGQSVTVDEADIQRLREHRWFASPARSKTGRLLGWYALATIGGKTIYMHRFLMDVPTGVQVDHIDRNGLNNRRANLRACSQAQNNANRQHDLPTSGYRGVHKHGRRWRAVLSKRGRSVYAGSFDSAAEAAKAYNSAAATLYGEFAVLNPV